MTTTAITTLGDEVYAYRVNGASERATAKHFGLTTKEARKFILERAPELNLEARNIEVALDLERFSKVGQRFYTWVMETDEPNVACNCASILIRLSERRSALLGTDYAPKRSDILTVISEAPKPSSTERIRAVIEAIVNERPPRAITNGKPVGHLPQIEAEAYEPKGQPHIPE